MLRLVKYGNQVIEYELTYKRVKNINLRVNGNGVISVSCNPRVALSVVDKFVSDNGEFILRSLAKVKAKTAISNHPVNYNTGEKVNVFGKTYTLSVIKGTCNDVKLTDTEVIVCCRQPENINSRYRAYEVWRRGELQKKVLYYSQKHYPHFQKLGVAYPTKFYFKTLKSKWGSCKAGAGELTFNYNLFETPDECIEYVVVHEFCHFLVQNHSAKFWAEVTKVLPDWKNLRKKLNTYT